MIRFLINAAIFLGSAVLGLWLADIILEDFELSLSSLLIAAIIFAVIQAILSPFFFKMTSAHAGAFLGGVGLISTFVALWLTSLIVDDLSVTGGWTTWLLPLIFLRNRRQERKAA